MSTPITAAATGSVADALHALEHELESRGIELFATIDHAAGARGVGLDLADEVVVVFGNPAVGTALMQSDPATGLDLPLRMLLWNDHGQTRVAYHDPRDLAADYSLAENGAVLDKLLGLLTALAAALV
jgi:uncharacterized protein (DUF302 family)